MSGLHCYVATARNSEKALIVQGDDKDEFNERQFNKNTYELSCAGIKIINLN